MLLSTRNWDIKVTQYECNNLAAPKLDCLQYHTSSSGTVPLSTFILNIQDQKFRRLLNLTPSDSIKINKSSKPVFQMRLYYV